MDKYIRSVGIKSSGYWFPENIITNSYFTQTTDVSNEWILGRTGISKRRKLADNESTSDLAFKAAKIALDHAKIAPDDIDLIILATSTPDMFFPSTACIVQDKLGASKAAAFDLSAACAGFVYGIEIGCNMIASHLYDNIIVIGAEGLTRFINWENKETSVLFGDGAGCVILSPSENERKIIYCKTASDGSGASILNLPAGGTRLVTNKETINNKLHCIHMNGKETYKSCIRRMTDNITETLEKLNLQISDIDYLITHQANKRIIEAVASKIKIHREKVHMNITYLGNTAAASIPIGLAECMEQNKFKSGDMILLATFGAGLTWGTCVIKW